VWLYDIGPNTRCVTVVPEAQGDFKDELSDRVVIENERVNFTFVTTNKRPDMSHETRNGTQKLVVNGLCTPTVAAYGCRCNVSEVLGAGYKVMMVCPTAKPLLAGTYIGTDNDDAENARKTEADLIVVAGAWVM